MNRFVIFLGIIIILDGIVSILIQIDESLIFQLGRLVRALIGAYFIFFGIVFEDKEWFKEKEKRSSLETLIIILMVIVYVGGLGLTAYAFDLPIDAKTFLIIIANFFMSIGSFLILLIFYYLLQNRKKTK